MPSLQQLEIFALSIAADLHRWVEDRPGKPGWALAEDLRRLAGYIEAVCPKPKKPTQLGQGEQ